MLDAGLDVVGALIVPKETSPVKTSKKKGYGESLRNDGQDSQTSGSRSLEQKSQRKVLVLYLAPA